MPSSYTANLGIEKPQDGEKDGVWGNVVNLNMEIIDRAINGGIVVALSGTTHTLTTTDGTLSDGQNKFIIFGGTPSGTNTVTIDPSDSEKVYFVYNLSGQSVIIRQGSGTTVTVANGDTAIVYADGGGAGAGVINITDNFAMNSVKITGGTITGITDLAIADGGTGASTAADARTNLGLVIGTDVQAYDAELSAIASLAVTDGNFIVGNGTTWITESGGTARTSLGLGTMATQNSSNVTITGGSISGITDLAVADGGTGASDAATARTNLGVAIGSNVQAYDAGLQSISGLVTSADQTIYTTALDTYATTSLTAFGRSLIDDVDAATARSTLGLGTLATQSGTFSGTFSGNSSGTNTGDQNIFQNIAVAGQSTVAADTTTDTLTLVAGSNVAITTNAATDTITISATGTVTSVDVSGGTTGLTTSGGPVTGSGTITLAGTLAVANGGTGATIASTARTNLGLGSISTQDSASVSITGGSISGITDLAIADGGTGASDAATARSNLGLAIGSNVQAYDADLAALAAISSTGMLTRTGSGTAVTRTITAGTGISVTNGDAVAGNPSVAFEGTIGTASVTATADADGTISSGTYTPTPVGGNFKTIINNGAFTFAAPTASGDYTLIVQMTNTASAGTVTFTGFSRVVGESLNNLSGSDFFIFITKCNGFTSANVQALQS